MQVCFGVGAEELEGGQMESDGVGDGKGRKRGHTMTVSEYAVWSGRSQVGEGWLWSCGW